MFFSVTTEYALRAVVFLAINKAEGTAYTSQDISETTKVPGAYLAKVLQALSRAGIVTSQRGLGGGFALAIDTNELNILQVINAVDPIKRIKTCPLKLDTHGVNLCPLHKELDMVMENAEAVLAKATLASLIETPSTSVPLCNELRETCAKRC
ncbi:MAG: Rrf2 family transcriptional regulator [Candidatus Melainabacteria bacterium]|nr:Rrf2 family transcriptional regulator [Candidatus Melainabacteria bacterium]